MIKCPSCGHENVDGTQFCEMCGEELGAAAKPTAGAPAAAGVDVSKGGAAPAGMVKCPACDNLNPADNVVCEVCGTELKPGALSGSGAASSPDAAGAPPALTPFDAHAQSQSASASTAASAPDPTAADAATATSSDASLPTVAISSADPQTTDPLATPAPPIAPAPLAPAPLASPDAASAALPSANDAAPAPAAAPAAGGVLEPGQVKLVVEQGMTVGKQFVLGDNEVLVGREDDEEGIYPDIDLSDQDEGYVHRRHALLKFENGALSVTHLGGANKTRVNNKPLADNAPQPVGMGDKVAFGKVVMRVQGI